jgi:hypothetical protein
MTNRLATQDSFSSYKDLNRFSLLNYSDSIGQDVKAEKLAFLRGMKKKIDVLEKVYVVDLSRSSQGFDQAISVTFASQAGLELYNTQPGHLRIQHLSQKIKEDFASYEYWGKME